MTEDDTFNKLRREDFYAVYLRWIQANTTAPPTDEALIGTGWTSQEFSEAFADWLHIVL